MAEHRENRHRHFILDGFADTERFVPPGRRGRQSPLPERNRHEHGMALLGQLDELKPELDHARRVQEETGLEGGFGLQVEFESFPEIELAFESLARERSGVELLNVRHDDDRTFATVFVPDGKLGQFEKLIISYLNEARDTASGPRNRKLIDTIHQIRAASLRALWTDDPAVFPEFDETLWWEAWLPIRADRSQTVATFRELAAAQNLEVSPGELEFPERTVILVYASVGQMQSSMMTLNSIAELRRAKETAEFLDLPLSDQAVRLDELLGRTRFPEPDETVPYVCLLDTGVNNGHPLIAPALADIDLHTVEPAWGTDDLQGHGTEMAGLALAGNLSEVLSSDDPIDIGYRLESVKLLPSDGSNTGDARHHGYLTTEAVERPRVTDPNRRRVYSMSVTARDNRDRGRPSAWSAALDRLAVDVDGNGETPQLLVVSAGNVIDPNAWGEYPESNTTDGIHDPAQAWNALTVGAYTDLVEITESDATGYQAIAPQGGLSPFSTTSQIWQPHWPLKPDVLFEGGNAAKDALSAVWMPSLSLLTTHHVPTQRLFTTTERNKRRHSPCLPDGCATHGRIPGTLARVDTRFDRSFGRVDGRDAPDVSSASSSSHEEGLRVSGSSLWVWCSKPRSRAVERVKFPEYGGAIGIASIPARGQQATDAAGHEPAPIALATR